MNKDTNQQALERLREADELLPAAGPGKEPVHVVYGGAHLFRSDTPEKLGRSALRSIESFAPNFVDFARAIWLEGADSLPTESGRIRDLEFQIADDPDKVRASRPEAWLAWQVFHKTVEKLENDPVEDYRIDFEDGYGIRTDSEEDSHCVSASAELAELFRSATSENGAEANIPATGFRIKSLQPETRQRALRTFDLFTKNLAEKTEGKIPDGFALAVPKIKGPRETEVLSGLLSEFERGAGLAERTISIEIIIETPESIPVLREIAEACDGRCRSAHFGAYDYTASLGIAAAHQHIRHKACDFARNMMQVAFAPLNIRLSDSVTTDLPIPVHKKENLSIEEIGENRETVRKAWRKHFNNVTHSQINGFYQSWDIHPAQLAARYAAVYNFYLGSFEEQAKRLCGFLKKATQAMTTGNLFDDLASAEGLLNFHRRGLNCGAFEIGEAADATGLSAEELASGSFNKIMKQRFARTAP